MGLDNGIVIKTKELIDKAQRPRDLFYNSWERGRKELEVVYYRKCWGLRDEILTTLNGRGQGYTEITIDDIDDIIGILRYFDNKEIWENEGRSIWEYEEICKNLKQHIKNLKWLKRYMKRHPENIEKVYFYDSY